jgi:hypothetical protein
VTVWDAHLVRKNEPLVAIDAHVGVVLVQVAVGDLLWQTQRVRCEVVPERAGPAKVAVDDENLTVGASFVPSKCWSPSRSQGSNLCIVES